MLIKRYCAICIFDIYNLLSMTYEKSCITFLQAFLSIIKCIPVSQKKNSILRTFFKNAMNIHYDPIF